MTLQKQDAALFFELMWKLQFYINKKLDILPKVKSLKKYVSLAYPEKVDVRDALWANLKLIEDYVNSNPDNLGADELAIVADWKHCIVDNFLVFRFLKKYAVFISTKNSQFYGVLGLHDDLEDLLDRHPLPIMIETVLLPFKEQIVYDGLFRKCNIYFGGGIRAGLKEDYDMAKQKHQIITTWGPLDRTFRSSVSKKNIYAQAKS